jgi:hypothetical protein
MIGQDYSAGLHIPTRREAAGKHHLPVPPKITRRITIRNYYLLFIHY